MKKRISRRQFLAAMGVAAAAGVLSGCGGSSSSASSSASSAAGSSAASVPTGEIVYLTYPLADGTKTISVYMRDASSGAIGNILMDRSLQNLYRSGAISQQTMEGALRGGLGQTAASPVGAGLGTRPRGFSR